MTTAERDERWVPAEPEFWIFVFGDLAVFTAFFFIWATAQRGDPELFAAGRATLNQTIGIANTALLLTSSAAVAAAVRSLRAGSATLARRWYLAGICLGAGFLILKAIEYAEHLAGGLGSLTGPFYVDYFVFTGVHALHVLLGVCGLAIVRARAAKASAPQVATPGSVTPDPAAPRMLIHEALATYWHMIDVVWIVLFSLIYLT
ncbi:MAG: cytochrome c oxidase subunit 3 [Nocardia sp.]|nr:cytochrome c oxidase subunit 3 [Nocardia sp.]